MSELHFVLGLLGYGGHITVHVNDFVPEHRLDRESLDTLRRNV